MDIITSAIVVIVTIIFIVIIGYVFYEIFMDRASKKYQTIYFLNHPYYNKGHRSKRGKYHCPRGCNNKGQCVGGPFCYNCEGDNPHCCCYDIQCAGCVKE